MKRYRKSEGKNGRANIARTTTTKIYILRDDRLEMERSYEGASQHREVESTLATEELENKHVEKGKGKEISVRGCGKSSKRRRSRIRDRSFGSTPKLAERIHATNRSSQIRCNLLAHGYSSGEVFDSPIDHDLMEPFDDLLLDLEQLVPRVTKLWRRQSLDGPMICSVSLHHEISKEM